MATMEDEMTKQAFGFTQGQTVREKGTGTLYTLNTIKMRGDAALIAQVSSVETFKDYYTNQMVPHYRTMNLCRLEAA